MGAVEVLSYAVAVAFTVYAVRQMISREWSRTQGLLLVFLAVLVPFSAIPIMAVLYVMARRPRSS